MNCTMNLHDEHALVQHHVVTDDTLLTYEPLYATALSLVCEGGDSAPSGYQLPEADAYAQRLAEEAEAWLRHARERSRMKDETLVRKALHALAFTLRHRAHDLAIPSKLSGTSKHQQALWRLTRSETDGRVGFGTALDVEEEADGKRVGLVVSLEGTLLGEVQSKHVGWLRPLVPFGVGLWLTRIAGHEGTYTLGCNVAVGRVGSAVAALNHALGHDHGGDGYGGDGANVAKPRVDTLVPDADPEADAADVVLYRGIDGTARATVRHVVRHSPTGIEWGYHGSGPADLARSVLLAFTDEATAERHYQAFKAEVVALVPTGGGVIRAADVRAWLAAQDNDQR